MLSKKSLIVAFSVIATAFLVWLLVGCGSETEQKNMISAPIPDYYIFKQETGLGKASVDILVSQKINEEQLTAIAQEIYQENEFSKYERVFMIIYLPGMVPDSGGYARANWNPDFEPEIMESMLSGNPAAEGDLTVAYRAKVAEYEAELARFEQIKAQFSAWDGSHIALKSAVKNSINDSKSFEHVETRYADNGDTITVTMRFRGANAFGAIVLDEVTAVFDLEGNMREVLEN